VATARPVAAAATAPRPPALPVREDASVVSARPRGTVPPPRLQRWYGVSDGQDLLRVCQMVESEVVARAGVTPAFATGVTGLLRRALGEGVGVKLSPSAIYYFIISEAGHGRDKQTAAQNLLAAHQGEVMRRLSALPVVQPGS
jgi:hypothetical protein